jgi:hypothetical protein
MCDAFSHQHLANHYEEQANTTETDDATDVARASYHHERMLSVRADRLANS